LVRAFAFASMRASREISMSGQDGKLTNAEARQAGVHDL
jgi:hypothetical protein